MRRQSRLSIFLCLALLAGLLSGCGGETGVIGSTSQDSQNMEFPDEELQKAVDLGFVPESLQGDYNAQISYAEFCGVLDAMISTACPDRLENWKTQSSGYREANDRMSRMEGMVVFLYAAQSAGLDSIGFQNNIPLEDLIPAGTDFWEGVTWDYPLLPNIDALYKNEIIADSEYFWRCEYPVSNNAVWFAECFSYGNGKTYFDYDESYSLHLPDALTCGDAIRAVERLYETARFSSYIPAGSAGSGVTAETLALAEKMPAVSYDHLPAWKGHTVKNRAETVHSGMGMRYTKDEIDAIASCGFNFVRVPLDTRLLFAAQNADQVSAAFLESMDELVNWCAQAGIHVCFDLHDMPGFTTDMDDSNDVLFTDPLVQETFCQFWAFMAEHYQNVPSNLISFNLLNEPHGRSGEELTDAVYSQVMLQAIEAIRAISPDRLIFVDMLGVLDGIPVEGLAEAKVVQTVHPYFLRDETEDWPCYSVNGFVHRDNGVLTLKGNFPAGTEIVIRLSMAHLESTLRWSSEKGVVSECSIGGEVVGENDCIEIGEEGTDGEWRRYENKNWAITLVESCTQLRLEQIGTGCWYGFDNILLRLPNQEFAIVANSSYVTDDAVPALTFSPDGGISARKESTLLCMDRAALEARFQSYREFSDRTGEAVMVQEFGFNTTIPAETGLAAAEDFLSVLDAYEIPWCCWDGEFGVLVHPMEETMQNIYVGETFLHENGSYIALENGWLLYENMMEVFQRYMG